MQQKENERPRSMISFEATSQIIKEAWYGGRTIVPIIGAGMSVDAGVPALAAIIRYLSILDAYIDKEFFLPGKLREDVGLKRICDNYRRDPYKYVEDFGWPDRFDLEYTIGINLPDEKSPNMKSVQSLVDEYRKHLIERLFEGESAAVASLLKLLETCNDPSQVWQSTSLLLDWRRLLHSYTGYRRELSDSLFSAIHLQREPGIAHKYLAEVVKLFGLTSIFTFNFDPLIEQALLASSISHQVFAMEHGKSLPSKVLVDRLSVIKMHGSTHNLLIDERLDYPLTEEYLKGFMELAGPDPLLLIIGCSGADRRLRDLVRCVSDQASDCWECCAIWTDFSGNRRSPLTRAMEPVAGMKYLRIRDAGLFLSHLYSRLTSRLPASSTKYLAHPTRYFMSVSADQHDLQSLIPQSILKELLTARNILITSVDAEGDFSRESTHNYLFAFLENVPTSLQQVYIDLESCYTVPGIVGEIIEQARRFDSSILPLVWHDAKRNGNAEEVTENEEKEIKAGVRRVIQTLNRSQICLVLDSLDGFIYRPTNHHGVVEVSRSLCLGFYKFVDILTATFSIEGNGNGSMIVICADNVVSRRDEVPMPELELRTIESPVTTYVQVKADYDRFIREQLASVARILTRVKEPSSDIIDPWNALTNSLASSPFSILNNPIGLICVFIASVRRTRSESLMREILRTVIGRNCEDDDKSATLLSELAIKGFLTELEGGYYSMNREVRNRIYRAASGRTGSVNIATFIGCIDDRDRLLSGLVCQLVNLSCIHSVISMIYYDKIFSNSKDASALLESTYHNLSAYRCLTDLAVVAEIDMDGTYVEFCKLLAGLQGGCKNDSDAPLVHLFDFGSEHDLSVFSADFNTTSQVTGNSERRNIHIAKSNFKLSLRLARIRILKRLVRNWQRHESLLQMSTTPELIISFCNSLLSIDLKKYQSITTRVDDLKHRVSPTDPNVNPDEILDGFKKFTGKDSADLEKCTREFRLRVFRTLVKSLWNTGDFETVAKLSYKLLVDEGVFTIEQPHELQQIHAVLLETALSLAQKNDNPRSTKQMAVEIEKYKFFRDPVVCESWTTLLVATASISRVSCCLNSDAVKLNNAVSILAKASRMHLESKLFGKQKHSFLEPFVRCLGLEVDMYLTELNEASCLNPEIEPKHLHIDQQKEIGRELVSLCQRSLQFLHDCESIGSPQVQDVTISMPEGSGLLVPYRSLVRLMMGRLYGALRQLDVFSATVPLFVQKPLARWSWLDDRIQLSSSQLKPAKTESSLVRQNWKEVFREYHYARSGLTSGNPTLKALCELHSAETALDSADAIMLSRHSGTSLRFRVAGSKLKSAESYLQSARTWLLNGSKYVLAWRHFSRLVLRHAAQSLGHRCGRLVDLDTKSQATTDKKWLMQEYGIANELVRSALKAVRDGLDHTPESEIVENAAYFHGWMDLMITSACYSILVAASDDVKRPLTSVMEIYKQYWMHANNCEDLRIGVSLLRWHNILDGIAGKENDIVDGVESGINICRGFIQRGYSPTGYSRAWQMIGENWRVL